jgi:hypothetical protein
MDCELAKELKSAEFPIRSFQIGHKFYPSEKSSKWSEASRENGVTITPYELQNHSADIEEGYYCPTLPDLIEACGAHFARLYVEAAIWTAESDKPLVTVRGHSPEEAVAKLWLDLQGKA